jgi:hypothetical protein
MGEVSIYPTGPEQAVRSPGVWPFSDREPSLRSARRERRAGTAPEARIPGKCTDERTDQAGHIGHGRHHGR